MFGQVALLEGEASFDFFLEVNTTEMFLMAPGSGDYIEPWSSPVGLHCILVTR